MKKHDQDIQNIFIQKFGSAPETIGYTIDNLPFWLMILLAGGLLAALMQKPWMVGFYGNEARFIKTSMWKTTSIQDETMVLKKSDIADVQLKKFGPAHTFIIKTQEGKTHRFVMNTLYKALESQPAAIEAMKRFTGVSS